VPPESAELAPMSRMKPEKALSISKFDESGAA
jgi:hypothetical protein